MSFFAQMLANLSGGVKTGVNQGSGDIVNRGMSRFGDAIFGGPPSAPSGAELGSQAADYYKNAFPGTNPWEQTGASNPVGASSVADVQAKTQRRNVNVQTATQKALTEKTTSTQKHVADVTARTKAGELGVQYGPTAIEALGNYFTKGKSPTAYSTNVDPRMTPKLALDAQDTATRERGVSVQEGQLGVNKKELARKTRLSEAQIDHMMSNPATAAKIAEAGSAYRALRGDNSRADWYKKYRAELIAAGMAAGVVDRILNALPGMFLGFIGKGSPGAPSVKTTRTPTSIEGIKRAIRDKIGTP